MPIHLAVSFWILCNQPIKAFADGVHFRAELDEIFDGVSGTN